MTGAPQPKVIPELACSDIEVSRRFYVDVLGFDVLYERRETRFAYLVRDGAALMLEEIGAGRPLTADELDYPLGRGMHLQIEVSDVDALYARATAAAVAIPLPLEERWYRANDVLLGNRQFAMRDPDGYVLRFFSDLGARPLEA